MLLYKHCGKANENCDYGFYVLVSQLYVPALSHYQVDGYGAGDVHAGADVAGRIDGTKPVYRGRKKVCSLKGLSKGESVWPDCVHHHADGIASKKDEAELQEIFFGSPEKEKHQGPREDDPPHGIGYEKHGYGGDHSVNR